MAVPSSRICDPLATGSRTAGPAGFGSAVVGVKKRKSEKAQRKKKKRLIKWVLSRDIASGFGLIRHHFVYRGQARIHYSATARQFQINQLI